MDEPFHYLSAEDVVPRDAVHVIVGGSVTVVPPHTFQGYAYLERVELQEGVEVIGAFAFANCPNLVRVVFPSSLRTIGDWAFAQCGLLEVILREGLEEIGAGAFYQCDLERIAVPSSVGIGDDAFLMCRRLSEVTLAEGVRKIGARAFLGCELLERITVPSSVVEVGEAAFTGCDRLSEVILQEGVREIGRTAFLGCALRQITVPSSVMGIGEGAFCGCKRLSEVNLLEGLRRIGEEAFGGCDLRRIAVPSSVVEIGTKAFDECHHLEAAILAGGTALLGRGAFFNCPRVNRIEIPSMAIVVKAGEEGNCQTVEVTGGIERDPSLLAEDDDGDDDFSMDEDEEPNLEPAQLILTSSYLALMSQEDWKKFTDAIDQLTDDQTRGAGLLDLGDEGVADSIRDCFANCLEEYKTGVAAVVELALWKANMNLCRGTIRARAAGGRKKARVDAMSRESCRCTCGADVVIGPVLSYLWGPHRRAGREENGGSTQL